MQQMLKYVKKLFPDELIVAVVKRNDTDVSQDYSVVKGLSFFLKKRNPPGKAGDSSFTNGYA
jgi:hypothetical protein